MKLVAIFFNLLIRYWVTTVNFLVITVKLYSFNYLSYINVVNRYISYALFDFSPILANHLP